MTALIEVVPNAESRVVDFGVASRTAERYELLAQLTRGLASAMLEGVQRAAQLNFEAAHHLLARTCMPLAGEIESGAESLRFARRTYEVCAITASRVLRLCRDHVQRDADQVWQALDDGLDRLALDTEHAAALRAAFSALRASHAAYFDAMLRMHEQLRGIADGVMVVAAPAAATNARRVNGQ